MSTPEGRSAVWFDRGRQWITRGRTPEVKPRGRSMPRRSFVSEELLDVPPILAQLKKDVPKAPWVVVVDGATNDVAYELATKLHDPGRASKVWLLSRDEVSNPVSENGLQFFPLNPDNPRDSRFAANLVADLVVITDDSEEPDEARMRQWHSRARYVLRERARSAADS